MLERRFNAVHENQASESDKEERKTTPVFSLSDFRWRFGVAK